MSNLTIWEISSFLQLPIMWALFRKFGKVDVLRPMLAGAIVGCFIEFSTEPLWAYHYRINVYKDVPLAVVLGWGFLLTLVTQASEVLYRWVVDRVGSSREWYRVVCDVCAGVAVALPLEAIGLKNGIWDYNYVALQWTWGTLPLIEMPYEALMGYALLMLIGPTYVRYWSRPLRACGGHLCVARTRWCLEINSLRGGIGSVSAERSAVVQG